MDYDFDSEQTSSSNGPASTAFNKSSTSNKRPRSNSDEKPNSNLSSTSNHRMQIDSKSDSEDEVPLSRSPTPPRRSFLPNQNAYSMSNSSNLKRSESSKASLDTPLSVDNLGYAMLMKMGWNGQQGLGKDGKGRLVPVEMKESGGSDGRGLGKLNQDVAHIIDSTSARRELQSEKQSREGHEEKLERERAAAAKASLQKELNHTLSTYKCELCEKQYSKTSELDNHLNSYDHHHKKRLKELAEISRAQARAKAGPNAAEKRREKERKKEEEAIRKASLAAGVDLTPSSSSAIGGISSSGVTSIPSVSAGGGGFKSIASGLSSSSAGGGGGGWKSLGSSSTSIGSTTTTSGGWKKLDSVPSSNIMQSDPSKFSRPSLSSFFGKGETVNLDTSFPPTASSQSSFQPIASPHSIPSGFKPVSSSPQVSSGFRMISSGFKPVSRPPPPPNEVPPPPPPPPM